MPDKLKTHRQIWDQKKILRIIYTEWYKNILLDIKDGTGKTVELGAGGGNFKKFKPDVIAADIEQCEWLDMCFDAHNMPFEDRSVSNIIMIDVLHHLVNPVIFLKEASRVLKKKGRIIMIEPYPSPFSLVIYGKFHPEPFIMDIDYFDTSVVEDKDPWESNQAIAYLLFFKYRKRLLELFQSDFDITRIMKMSCILYPASGGFENNTLIPDFLIPVFKFLEFILSPFRWFLAFRCYIVLEKK